jgi:hypothetical protein
MMPDAIDSLAQAVPAIRQERPLPDNWAEDFDIVADQSELAGEVEDDLFGDQAGGGSALPPDSATMPDLPSVEAEIEMMDLADNEDYGEIPPLTDRIRETVGNGFPGAPAEISARGTGNGTARLPTPDELAFYLPWHEFPLRAWGIYLIAQGIKALGRDIHSLSRNWLSRAEANRVACMFLFHHEAYHNAVETFAARLEVSHRKACYIAGFRTIWLGGFGNALHEEGLANAYAHDKVWRYAFEKTLPAGSLRTFKRSVAAAAMRRIMRSSPPPYNCAANILSGAVGFDDAEHDFQESNHGACGFGPRSAPEIWLASGHSMHPSLRRNHKFSYLIDRNHPSIRQAASVPHYNRREFARRLAIAVGGQEAGGGKHPKMVASDGKRVPVPGHRELDRRICRKILKEFGLTLSLKDFMGAMDKELAGLRAAA